MVELSDDLLAAILAKIPFAKAKVAMQAVDSQWRRVLRSRAAHSAATFEDDDHLPDKFHIVGHSGEGMVSPLLVAALAVCKFPMEPLDFDSSTLASLPVHLEILEISPCIGDQIWEDCPNFLILKRLILSMSECDTDRYAMTRLCDFFPNLQEVVLDGLDLTGTEMEASLNHIQNLPNLTLIDIVAHAGDPTEIDMGIGAPFFDFKGPLGCKVRYSMHVNPYCDTVGFSQVPAGLAAQLIEVTYSNALGFDEKPTFDLSVFSNCVHLERLCLVKLPQAMLGVCGIDNLPESCQSVVIESEISIHHENFVAPLLQFSRHWVGRLLSDSNGWDYGVELVRSKRTNI